MEVMVVCRRSTQPELTSVRASFAGSQRLARTV